MSTEIVIDSAAESDEAVQALFEEWKPLEWGGTKSYGRYLYFAARVDGELVGALEGHHDYGNWDVLEDYQHLGDDQRGSYVSALYVRPTRRRRGVAGALLDAFIADAQTHETPVIVAWPDEDRDGREARIALNRSRGFEFARYPEGVREPWLMTRRTG